VRGTIEHDVHFATIFVAEVMEANLRAMPAGLAAQFLEYKGLNKMAKGLAVAGEIPRIEPEQRACHSRIPHVNLWSFDQTAEPIAVPRWQDIQQEDALKQCDIVTNRRAT
jgi:hypothetical protein